ncbi:hypothetical protein F4703DRAFT_1070305 [Phycomyces blakesleeanus]|uniref:RRM domain-containing protein n=1 Tax=Phycomyces blakesleeanus (strain ATCC 8743b / DSM 1359 / FGSC 10004 / NBRC 33097 / NRRL 1555) TaxID=763407 RepID=A0A162UZZ5_PHYB8|nr:hypothetical protein PHYBLDRAFT_178961 [Phycomyces blakesleeanus NRRL 1555(-)]OAD79092.1 hypothetical protein PHYBLDRAFT_178961 [Phycomyces blakesleeanus NRRL 1555(-)]|eukprot:XP_018297132.1 hypothetical protein PHYBLDRAFT_178961 [Phycomyces blakesleeanus NRRL 1555(-)]
MDMDVEAMLDAPFQENKTAPVEPERHHEVVVKDDRHREERRSRRSSRSPSRSHGSRSRHSRRHRSRSREYRRSGSRSTSRDRRRRPSRERRRRSPSPRMPPSRGFDRNQRRRGRARSPSPPLPEEERDRRTVFVTQLAQRLKSRELEDFFTQAGRVRDAKIIFDRHSGRSKGVGYVEFYDEDSVQSALAMSGQKLLGIPVVVQLTEAEKNRLAMQAAKNAQMAAQDQELFYQRLYVGSIHFSLTEDDIRQIFEPFGPLDFVNLHKDPETGKSKGYAFIQYKNAEDSKQALEKMNGFELAGRNLKVGLVTEKTSVMSSSLDDDAGLALNSLSRTELMKKLAARQTDLMEELEPSTPFMPPKPIIPVSASRTVMLNNMFNPSEESEPDWMQDLETDVKDECLHFGQVTHIHVNEDSLGEIFVKFGTVDAAERAVKALNGRWFGGRQITAAFVSEAIYNAKFSL